MPTDLAQIQTIKSQTLARLVSVTASDQPDYSIDGQTVSKGQYLAQLKDLVAWCDAQLAGDDPYEIHTSAFT